jgi:hypothetical protein
MEHGWNALEAESGQTVTNSKKAKSKPIYQDTTMAAIALR